MVKLPQPFFILKPPSQGDPVGWQKPPISVQLLLTQTGVGVGGVEIDGKGSVGTGGSWETTTFWWKDKKIINIK